MLYCKEILADGERCKNQARYRTRGPKAVDEYCNAHKKPGMANNRNVYCVVGECPKQATTSADGKKPLTHCKACAEKAGITYVNVNKPLCKGIVNGERCKKSPSYMDKGKKTPTHCGDCKTVDMVDIHEKCVKCKIKAPCYGVEGTKKRTHCAGCKTDDLVNLSGKFCEGIMEDGKPCSTLATFGGKKGEYKYCVLHKEKDDIPAGGIFCKCGKRRATFGVPGINRPICCFECKLPGYVDVVETRKCITPGCNGGRPSYGLEGAERAEYCAKCADKSIMVNLTKRKCDFEGICHNNPSFIDEDNKRYCKEHSEGKKVIDLHKKCSKCNKRATCGFREDNIRITCGIHKEEGMVYLERKKCELCNESARYGYLFQQKSRCLKHIKTNMYYEKYVYPKCKTVDCKNDPFYCEPGMRYPTHCELHKLENYVNVIEKNCSSCGLPDLIPDDKNVCRDCDASKRTAAMHEKELRIKTVFDAHEIEYVSHDKIPRGACNSYRPDFIIDAMLAYIIVEVDENQHKSYACECEEKRMILIHQDFGGCPVIFIRYNPDNFKDPGGNIVKGNYINKFREPALVDLINRIKSEIASDVYNLVPLSAYYLYYDGFDGNMVRNVIDYENHSVTAIKE